MVYVGKGLGAIKEALSKSTEMLKIKSGESKTIRILTPMDEIISVWEHIEQIGGQTRNITCLGKQECPLCKAGRKPLFKSYLAVIDRDDDKVKIFKASKKVGVQLLGLAEEYGDLRSRDFKISRTGDKFDTTYQFFPKDKSDIDFSKYEDKMPDIEAMVAPKSKEEILALMSGMVIDSPSEDQGDYGAESEQEYPF